MLALLNLTTQFVKEFMKLLKIKSDGRAVDLSELLRHFVDALRAGALRPLDGLAEARPHVQPVDV